MMGSKEEMVDVLEIIAVFRFFSQRLDSHHKIKKFKVKLAELNSKIQTGTKSTIWKQLLFFYIDHLFFGHYHKMTRAPSKYDRDTVTTRLGYHHNITGTPSQGDRDTIKT